MFFVLFYRETQLHFCWHPEETSGGSGGKSPWWSSPGTGKASKRGWGPSPGKTPRLPTPAQAKLLACLWEQNPRTTLQAGSKHASACRSEVPSAWSEPHTNAHAVLQAGDGDRTSVMAELAFPANSAGRSQSLTSGNLDFHAHPKHHLMCLNEAL